MAINPTLELRHSRTLAMTSDLRQAIGFLRRTNREIASDVALLARANPHLGITPTAPPIGLWTALAGPERPAGPPMPASPGVGPLPAGPAGAQAEVASAAPGLLEHVLSQLNLLVRNATERPIALALAAALEPSGWLTCPMSEIARDCGCSIATAEAVLAQLQRVEPAGLFARSLAECLRLQAADRDLLTAEFGCLIDNLPLLARGDLAEVAARCCCDIQRVQEMLRHLRRMDPKPGARFDAGPSPVREPDLVVWKNDDDWMVALNRSNLPAVRVIEGPDATASKDGLRAARFLERAVWRRNATTLQIARAVMGHQAGFLAAGASHMRPLSFADVAEWTGLHVSTISRVTTGLMIATPGDTIRFRDFFSPALGAPGAEVALAVVLHDLKALISSESADRPLGDQEISDHFAAKGLVMARRTVAKYRSRLKIPTSAKRRNFNRLDAGS
jgi:RNA polymerase sigma-54 factor